MKYALRMLLGALLIIIASANAEAQFIKTSVSEIVSNPIKYDGKMVQAEGKVTNILFKISKRGNPYYTFSLGDSDRHINVFSFGKPKATEGAKVRVKGLYQIEKQVTPTFTARNQIDASKGSVDVLR